MLDIYLQQDAQGDVPRSHKRDGVHVQPGTTVASALSARQNGWTNKITIYIQSVPCTPCLRVLGEHAAMGVERPFRMEQYRQCIPAEPVERGIWSLSWFGANDIYK